MSRHIWNRAAALAITLCASLAAQATSFDLRSVQTYRNWVGNADPETATQGFADLFNNSNLTTGPTYTGGLTTPAALYTVIGGSAPTEVTPGDLTTPAASLFGSMPIGRVRFDQANAAAASLIQINGSTYSNQAYRLNLANPTGTVFLNNGQVQFMAEAYFGFTTPGADERYGVRFSDATGVAGSSFDDIITLDVVRMTNGAPGVQIRRLTGTSTNLSTSGVQTVAVSSFLSGSATLADVSLIDLRLFWEPNGTGGNVVTGRVELVNVLNGVPSGLVGSTTLSNTFDIFHGEAFTNFQVGASWAPLAAVPEPASWALMLAGALAVGAGVQRRRR